MFKFLLFTAFVPALVLAQIPMRDCRNGAVLPASVEVNGCTTPPCYIQNGAPVRIVLRGITSEMASNDLRPFIMVMMSGFNFLFPIPDGLQDACAVGTAPGTCPVSIGQTFDYELNHGGHTLPLTARPGEVLVGLHADSGFMLGCAEFDAFFVG